MPIAFQKKCGLKKQKMSTHQWEPQNANGFIKKCKPKYSKMGAHQWLLQNANGFTKKAYANITKYGHTSNRDCEMLMALQKKQVPK